MIAVYRVFFYYKRALSLWARKDVKMYISSKDLANFFSQIKKDENLNLAKATARTLATADKLLTLADYASEVGAEKDVYFSMAASTAVEKRGTITEIKRLSSLFVSQLLKLRYEAKQMNLNFLEAHIKSSNALQCAFEFSTILLEIVEP